MLLLSKQHLGPDHPDTLTVLADLATSYEMIGRHARATQLRGSLLQIRESIARSDGTPDPPLNLDASSYASELLSNSSDDDSIVSEVSHISKNPTISTNTSYGSDRASVAESLAVAFENDLDLVFSYEDSLLIMSRRQFVRNHMDLLKAYFSDVRVTTHEHYKAIKLLSGNPQLRIVAEKIFNRTSINTTIQRAAKQNIGEALGFSRLQLPDHPGGEIIASANKEFEEEDSLDPDQSSDDSGDCDRDNFASIDEFNESQFDELVQLLTEDVSFSKYKDDLRSFISRQFSPRTLRYVISLGNVDAVRGVIERHFEAVATEEYEWIQELKSLGYGYYDIAELLVDDVNESPWIFFNAPEPREVLIFEILIDQIASTKE